MIELPEAINLGRQMKERFAGRRIISAVAAASPHKFAWYSSDPAFYGDWLADRRVVTAANVGGQAELRLEDGGLVFSDGALLRYSAPGAPRPAKHQLLLELDDGAALTCSVQMYAGIMAYDGEGFDNEYYKVAKLKPSPLDDAFTPEYFNKIYSETSKNLSAKALLATKQRIPGLGNGVLQDILYKAGINPQRKLSTLSDSEVEALYNAVRTVLREMTDGGGRNVETDLYGEPGGYVTRLSRLTLNTPCPVCGQIIVKKQYMGGVVYFCPGCQPL